MIFLNYTLHYVFPAREALLLSGCWKVLSACLAAITMIEGFGTRLRRLEVGEEEIGITAARKAWEINKCTLICFAWSLFGRILCNRLWAIRNKSLFVTRVKQKRACQFQTFMHRTTNTLVNNYFNCTTWNPQLVLVMTSPDGFWKITLICSKDPTMHWQSNSMEIVRRPIDPAQNRMKGKDWFHRRISQPRSWLGFSLLKTPWERGCVEAWTKNAEVARRCKVSKLSPV